MKGCGSLQLFVKAHQPTLSRVGVLERIEQGGPILFNILKSFVIKKSLKGKFDTYKVNGKCSISHLLYADDILIFSNANPSSFYQHTTPRLSKSANRSLASLV